LLERLGLGEFAGLVRAPAKGHALFAKPIEDLPRFGMAHLLHRGVKRGLAEPLLKQTGWMQQLVRDDCVEHAHATFIEDTQNRFVLFDLASSAAAQVLVGRRKLEQAEVAHMALIVGNGTAGEPLAQAALEEIIGKILAPKAAVFDTRL